MTNYHPARAWSLAAFNAAPADAAERDVLACCASESFAKAIADGRPYPGPAALWHAIGIAFKALTCASGLSGREMLDQLQARLGNDRDAERAVVRRELENITRLRMKKLLHL